VIFLIENLKSNPFTIFVTQYDFYENKQNMMSFVMIFVIIYPFEPI